MYHSISMQTIFRVTLVVLLATTLAMAAKTRIVSSWMNPEAAIFEADGQKVATFVLTLDSSMRLGPEETLAEELRSRGLEAVAGYLVLPRELEKDQNAAKEFIQKGGISAALIMRVLGNADETTYVPGTTYYSSGYYPTFWGYWGHYSSFVYEPGYSRTDRVVTIEILFYSVKEDRLIWAGKSSTTNPKDIRKFVNQLVTQTGKAMRKAGLLIK